uniref:Uncharacterized protein n=1 Tax=Knipowitschia caucasica TaxID=637954 RepID=A0AAV2ME75_KNICA
MDKYSELGLEAIQVHGGPEHDPPSCSRRTEEQSHLLKRGGQQEQLGTVTPTDLPSAPLEAGGGGAPRSLLCCHSPWAPPGATPTQLNGSTGGPLRIVGRPLQGGRGPLTGRRGAPTGRQQAPQMLSSLVYKHRTQGPHGVRAEPPSRPPGPGDLTLHPSPQYKHSPAGPGTLRCVALGGRLL